jgi:alpha-1,6-mannosyltransferase
VVVAAERGWVWGAVLVGLAAAVKAPAGLVGIGVVLVSLPLAATVLERGRRFVQVGLVSGVVLLGAGVLVGTGAGWLHALGVPGRVNVPWSLTTLVGGSADWVAGVLGAGTEPATYLTQVRHLGTLAAAGTAVWVAVRWPTGRRGSAVTAMTLVLGTLVLLSPVVHIWYVLWVLPFVAAQQLSRLAMSLLVGLSVVLGLVAPLDSSLHGAYLAIVLVTMLVLVLVLGLLLTKPARERLGRIAAQPEDVWRAGSTVPVTSPSRSRPPDVDGAL